jgi:hypothetical protein
VQRREKDEPPAIQLGGLAAEGGAYHGALRFPNIYREP